MRPATEIDTMRKKALWRLLWKSREHVPYEFISVVRHLREQGNGLDLPDLMYLQERIGDRDGPFVVPLSVARFFGQLIKTRDSQHVLDPSGGYGFLGAWLSAVEGASRVDVISQLLESAEITSPLNIASLQLYVGTFSDCASLLAPQYDAIIANGLIGLPKERRTYETSARVIELTDYPACLRIPDVAGRLSQNGFIAFVMPPRFGIRSRSLCSVRRNLDSFGLHLAALLTFKPGAFAGSAIAFDLAIITREPQDKLFVARVPQGSGGQQELVSRLWNRTPATVPGQGRLVVADEFLGLAALEAKERLELLVKGKGLKRIATAAAVTEVRAPRFRGKHFERCEEHPLAVYLPRTAMPLATIRQEELPEKPGWYFQLLVNPEEVLPEYLAEFLNTPMGRALRESVMAAGTIRRISMDHLKNSTLYLVPIPDQKRVIEAKSEIHRLRNELVELESKIWARPRKARRVIEELGRVNHQERFEEWIETLPFPLASILRSYHAKDQTDKDKCDRLLHFFEALALFVATIHLSAFRTNAFRWHQELSELQKLMREHRLSLERPTFGLWKLIVERLGKSLRSMLNSGVEEAGLARTLYATADSSPLETLASKKVVGVLQAANRWRNEWSHGTKSLQKAAEIHRALRKELEEFRSIVGVQFLQYELIEAGKASIRKDRVKLEVKRVMGSNSQLEQARVEVKTRAEEETLYLYNTGHDEALELLPLVEVRKNPQPASYFYSGSENSKRHLVAYHDTETSELSGPIEPLRTLLEDLAPSPDTEEGAD